MLNNIALLLIMAILASLASGLFFLYKDDGDRRRITASLTFRITLSFCLFLVVLYGFIERMGWFG